MIEANADGIRIRVRVRPRAARTEMVGAHGDALKVRVAAPPVDGAANQALVRFLAGRLGVPRAAVTVASGQGSRTKVLRVTGITVAEAVERLGLRS